MKKLSFIAVALLTTTSVNAEIIKIPTQSGFSGFVMGGVGILEYKSNMYKGYNGDNESHNGLFNSPESYSSGTPILGADLRYTFAETRTQLFLGNLIQDAVRFDFTQQLGVRQQMGDKGIVALGYVFPLLPTETWADPYAAGNRQDTDMKSGGARLAWDQIWGTHFNATYTMRKFDISEERSGESMALSNAQRNMLNRNGNTNEVALSYDWIFSPGHVLHPELTYGKSSFDGSAMNYDKTQIQLSYGYNNNQWSLISNIYLGHMKYDEVNPIFGNKADSDEFGVSTTFFWHRLFNVKGLNGLISASYSKSNSDINFYDAYISSINTGLMYHF
ncbi:DUF2860 family protein [Aeromonas sp. HMWF016]|uniref:DUF2860 family protein n=1 Tax=Aeromonas sp. HMWF016 TaxID=2056852 RepID=UPI000D369A0D|nr:DUF2860 family protein [Aeromonas sp. HMWF016]PTT45997.1 hypothetical protein DBR09_13250 [Aeromonas sp. HMWF016]